MTQSLEDVLGGVEEKVEAPIVDTPTGDDVTLDKANPDDAALAAKPGGADPAKEDPATPADKPKVEEDWTKAAALDERRKRQEVERKLAEATEKLSKFEVPAKRPDLFEDPEGALGSVEKALTERFSRALNDQRLEMSREMMRDRDPEYDVLEAEFIDMAKDNPILLHQLAESRFPAKYAYETAKKARQLADLGNVDKLRAELEAKIRAEIEAKNSGATAEREERDGKKREALAPSLAAAQSKAGLDDRGNESLDDILNSRKK